MGENMFRPQGPQGRGAVPGHETDEGEIMGVKHKTLPIWGVQFHPESILTESGRTIMKNFLKLK